MMSLVHRFTSALTVERISMPFSFFLCAHQILTRTKLTWNQLLIFGGNNWYTKLHMFEFEEDVDSEFTAAFVENLLNIC